MIEAQLLTPDSSYDEHRAMYEARIGLYTAILARHGVTLSAAPWTSARADRPGLACLAWGYHHQPQRWLALLDGWPSDVPLVNPRDTLRWNTDKRYLANLAGAGVSTVPTIFAPIADEAMIAEARARFGPELVVKPRVSASAHATVRLGPAAPAPDLAEAMIQPFLPAVTGEGEISLLCFGGEIAFAMRKVAASGDFRVQREFGGAFEVIAPDQEAQRVARTALAVAPVPPTYARVDLVRCPDGRLAIMELELIEPDFYLDLMPAAEDLFGAAVAASLVASA